MLDQISSSGILSIVIVIAAINLQGFMQKYWKWKRVKYVIILSISALALSTSLTICSDASSI